MDLEQPLLQRRIEIESDRAQVAHDLSGGLLEREVQGGFAPAAGGVHEVSRQAGLPRARAAGNQNAAAPEVTQPPQSAAPRSVTPDRGVLDLQASQCHTWDHALRGAGARGVRGRAHISRDYSLGHLPLRKRRLHPAGDQIRRFASASRAVHGRRVVQGNPRRTLEHSRTEDSVRADFTNLQDSSMVGTQLDGMPLKAVLVLTVSLLAGRRDSLIWDFR